MKVILSILLMVLSISSSAYSLDNSIDQRCLDVEQIDQQINDIHLFIKNASKLSSTAYFKQLSDLYSNFDFLRNRIHGCDIYSDQIIRQMDTVVNVLLSDKEQYVGKSIVKSKPITYNKKI